MTWEQLIGVRCREAQKRSRKRNCGEEPLDKLMKEADELLHKQKYACALCGKTMTFEKKQENTASLDRIFSSVKLSPQREAKCGYLHNMRWVCTSCNHATRSCHMKNAKYKTECK
jgi:transposase-like protein